MDARNLIHALIGVAVLGLVLFGAEPPADPIGRLLESTTFPKMMSEDDWTAVVAARKDPAATRQRLVQQLLKREQGTRNAFYLIGYLPLSLQEEIMWEVVSALPVGDDHPDLEAFLTRLIPFDKPWYVERIASEIQAGGEGRAAHLAIALTEAAQPQGTALVASLAEESTAAWVDDPRFQQALRWATWRGLGIEFTLPRSQFASREEVVIGFTVRNKGSEELVVPLPGEGFMDSGGWVDVLCNGKRLRHLPRAHVKSVPTMLGPGEQITVYTKPSQEFVWPDDESPVERYTVRLAPDHPFKTVPARGETRFTVVHGSGEVYPERPIATENEWVEASIQIHAPPSARRASVLRSAAAANDPERFWKLVRECDDPWAIRTSLEFIPGAGEHGAPELRGQADELIRLSEHKDLAVRRVAFKLLAQTHSNGKAADELARVVARQRDEMTRTLAESALRAASDR